MFNKNKTKLSPHNYNKYITQNYEQDETKTMMKTMIENR